MILNETLLAISVLKRNIFLPSAVFFFQQNYQSYSRAGIERTNEQRASVPNNCSDETELNLENSDVCGERIENNVQCSMRYPSKNVSSQICSTAVVSCCVSHKIFLLLDINNKNSFRVKIRDKSIPVFESFSRFGCRNELCKTNIKHRLDHPNVHGFC